MNNKGKRLNRVILRGDVYWNWENENGIVRPIPKIIDDNNAPVVRTTKVDIVFNDEVIFTHTYNQLDTLPDVGELLPAGYVYIDPKYKIQKYVYNKFIVVYDYYDVVIHYLDGNAPSNNTQFGEFRQRYKYGTVVNKSMVKWPEGKKLDTEWFDFVVGYRTSARIIHKYMYFSNTSNDTSYPWGTAPTNLTAPTTIEYVDTNFPTVKNVITTPFPLFGDRDYRSYYPLVRSNMESYRDIITPFLKNPDADWNDVRGGSPDDEIDFRGRVSKYSWTINSNVREIKKYDEYLYESKHTSINKECTIDGVQYWPFSLFLCVGYHDKIPFVDGGITTNKMYADIEYENWLAQGGKEYIEDYIQKFFAVYPNDIEKRPTSMSEKDFLEYYHNNIDKIVHSIKDKYGNDTIATITNASNDYNTEVFLDFNIKKYINRHEYDKNSWLYRQYVRIEPFSPYSVSRINVMDITINGVTKKLFVTICSLVPTAYACALLEKNGKIYKFFYQLLTRYEGELSINDFVSMFPNNASDGTPLKNDSTINRVKQLKTTPQSDVSWTGILKIDSTVIGREEHLMLYNTKDAHEQNPTEAISDPNKIPGEWADISQKELLSKTKTHIDTYVIETRTTGAAAGPSVQLTRYKVYFSDANGVRKDLETDLYLMSGESVINALDYPKKYQLKEGTTPTIEPYNNSNGWYPVRVNIERTRNTVSVQILLKNPDNHTHEDWNNRIDRPGIEINTPMKVLDGTVMTVDMIKDYVLASSYNREWFTKTEEVRPIGLFHKDGTPVENEAIYDDVEYVLQFRLMKSDIIYHEISLLDRIRTYSWLNGNVADLDFCLAAFWVKETEVYGPTEYEFKQGKRLRSPLFRPFIDTSPARTNIYYAINDNYELAKGVNVSFDIIRNGVVIHSVVDYPLEKLFGTNALKNPIKLPNSRPAYSEYLINNLYYILTHNMTDIDPKDAYLKAGLNFYGLQENMVETGPDGGAENRLSSRYIPLTELDIKVKIAWTGDLLSKGVIRDNVSYKLVIDFLPSMLLPYVNGNDFNNPESNCVLTIGNLIHEIGIVSDNGRAEPHKSNKNTKHKLLTDNAIIDDGQAALFYRNPNQLNYGVGCVREMLYMLTSIVLGGTRGYFARMHQARFMSYDIIPIIGTNRHFGIYSGTVRRSLGAACIDKNNSPHPFWHRYPNRCAQALGVTGTDMWENNGLMYTPYADGADFTFLSNTILKIGDDIYNSAWRNGNTPLYGTPDKEKWYDAMHKYLGKTVDEAAVGFDMFSFHYSVLGFQYYHQILEALGVWRDNSIFRMYPELLTNGDMSYYASETDFASTTPTSSNNNFTSWKTNNNVFSMRYLQSGRPNELSKNSTMAKAYIVPTGTKINTEHIYERLDGLSVVVVQQRNPLYNIIDKPNVFEDTTKKAFWRHAFVSYYNAYMNDEYISNDKSSIPNWYNMTRILIVPFHDEDKNFKPIGGVVVNGRLVGMVTPDSFYTAQSNDLIVINLAKNINSKFITYVAKP